MPAPRVECRRVWGRACDTQKDIPKAKEKQGADTKPSHVHPNSLSAYHI